jgi:predicted nuclease of predicted toxin-antitoxin system
VRLLIDQNLPRSLVTHLADAGHDATHTGELGLEKATDPDVFAVCIEQDRMLVTSDES